MKKVKPRMRFLTHLPALCVVQPTRGTDPTDALKAIS